MSNVQPVIATGALLTLAVVATISSGCNRSKSSPATPSVRATAVEVEFSPGNLQQNSVRTEAATPTRERIAQFTGRLIWNEDLTNRVFSPVSGRVESIAVTVGQAVKSGDDLAVLRSPDFGQAQADYRRATADLVQATKTLARATALRKFGAAAEKDLEGAESDFNRAAAENRRAEARLRSLGGFDGEFSDQYHLISPVAGVVVDRSLNVGQEVRADIILAGTPQLAAPHFVVTDPSRLWVALDVPESDLNRLQQGQSIEVRSTAFPGRSFTGTIENIGAFLDPQTRVARVRASVDNSAGLLKAEMYVMVRVTDVQRTASTVDIPSRAVVFSNGRTYVFVETNPLRFERREVSVESEDRGDGNRMSVSGVAAGERVVSEGSLLINELLVEPGESATVGEADSPRG